MLLCNKKALLTTQESFTGSEWGIQASVSEHKPIFIAACNMANSTDRIEFYEEDCMDQFLTLILQDKKYKKRTFIAHNAGGYDCQFVMRWIEHHGQKPSIILSPTSLYRPFQLTYDGVHLFIDSWNFITIPLSKFGKCFGLTQSTIDFHHAFSRRENLDHEESMPPFDTPEDFFGLKHIKGGSVQETLVLRKKPKQALACGAAKLYSNTDPNKPLWKYRDQLIACWIRVDKEYGIPVIGSDCSAIVQMEALTLSLFVSLFFSSAGGQRYTSGMLVNPYRLCTCVTLSCLSWKLVRHGLHC
jgi:hypothetical protein